MLGTKGKENGKLNDEVQGDWGDPEGFEKGGIQKGILKWRRRRFRCWTRKLVRVHQVF